MSLLNNIRKHYHWRTSAFLIAIIYLISICGAQESNGNLETESNVNSDEVIEKSDNETWIDVLKRDVLLNYDKYSRPAEQNRTVSLRIGISLTHINLDEMKGSMEIYGWLKFMWTDRKLTWNASNYGGLNAVHLPAHEIWLPDIGAYNSASLTQIEPYGNTLTIAYYSGDVLWVPPFRYDIFCEMNFLLWPFDTQTCILSLGSWSYTDQEMLVDLYDSGYEMNLLTENHEWSIKSVKLEKVKSTIFPNSTSVKYYITVERRSPLFRTIVVTPVSCVVILILSAFWLPAQTGEKILLNGINIIFIFSFMLYFSQMLPTLALTTPLVVLFYSSSLVLASISMILAVLVISMSTTKHQRRIPSFLKGLLSGPTGTILLLGSLNPQKIKMSRRDQEMQEDHFESQDGMEDHPYAGDDGQGRSSEVNEQHEFHRRQDSPSTNSTISIQHEWLVLATAIDRLCFLIYCVVFATLAIYYSV